MNIIKNNKNKICFALNHLYIPYMHFILNDNEAKNSEDNDFIEELKEFSKQEEDDFIVFDKKDITLKIHIDKFKMNMPEQEFYSIVDAKINNKIKPKDIIKKLEQISKHLELRLEADDIDQIIRLMKSKILIEKLREQGIKFLHKDIEIEPRIIESKMDEDYLKIEVKEIKAKRDRLNMDCDK